MPGGMSSLRFEKCPQRWSLANLPPGRYTVRVEKGAEFRAVEKIVDLSGIARIELDAPRFCDMNAKGWYCGDLHIHRSPEEVTGKGETAG